MLARPARDCIATEHCNALIVVAAAQEGVPIEGRQRYRLGATYLGRSRTSFCVWAPQAGTVEVRLAHPAESMVPLDPQDRGYFQAIAERVEPGTRYFYRLNSGIERPDPASRFQPEGVHGPSEVTDSGFDWGDDDCWHGLPLQDYVFYELHVGALTPEGTFDAIIPRLAELRDLGITAVELMPVAQFAGERNWGYDGVFPFAPQNSYGGPCGLKRLVRACHEHGLAAVLDVVYNHLGPEGNYLAEYGPYFTDRHKTPWGRAINFDGPDSDEVRRYFIENALYWIDEFHSDALRLDAIHTILENSAHPFLVELAEAVHARADELGRRAYLVPESDLNDARVVTPAALGGYGHDAQWADDFHHALHTLLTGERDGYYRDFGSVCQLAKAFREGFVYSGEYAPARRRRHGNSPRLIEGRQLVVFSQNHDQVGNRMFGERLSALAEFESQKLAAALVLLSPFLPLIFMGEEYGETAPFLYFVSHSEPWLVEAVRKGRREEFSAFTWLAEPPDPQSEQTFVRSKLDHSLRRNGRHRVLQDFYKELLRLRRALPSLAEPNKTRLEVVGYERQKVLFARRWNGHDQSFAVFTLAEAPESILLPVPAGRWQKALDSAAACWQGAGSHLPDEVVSEGDVTLKTSATSMALFSLEKIDRPEAYPTA